jgi:transcriptional regulator with XRE-family HTH domain
MKRALNLIGPNVRKLRDEKGWTQEVLAQKCQLAGWDITRASLAKLEAQVRRVPDGEVLFLAKILRVPTDKLFPPGDIARLAPTFRNSIGKDDRKPPTLKTKR